MQHGGIIIDGIKNYFQGLDWSALVDILLSVIPALICITFHELSHGFVAYKLGDNTAKKAGRLTLNPIKHIDPVGLLMMVVLKFGWAKPVPVNMYNFKKPKRDMAITALAGPVSNILLAAFMLLIYGFAYTPIVNGGEVGEAIQKTILTTAYLSCALAVFNIIPISPLDGSKVLFSILPEKAYFKLMQYERYGFIILLLLIWSDVLTPYLSIATNLIYSWLINISQWSFSLTI